MKRSLVALVAFCCIPIGWASPPSLCSSQEQVLFSCSVGRKLVSVCASKDLSRTAGYVQYVFGNSRQRAELVFPEDKVHPASRFSYGEEGAAKSSLENLQFTLAGHSYTIYRQSAAFEGEGAGVRVKTPDGQSRRLDCKGPLPDSNLWALHDLGVRTLPHEALVSLESFDAWPAESPTVDLLQGVRTHDFTLVASALKNGANVNFHGPHDAGVLAALVDGRPEAFRRNQVAAFDAETDRLLALLLASGASPTTASENGATAVDYLAHSAPSRTLRTLLDAGWPGDYAYRLYAGALLGDPAIVKDALDRGVDPNQPNPRGGRYLEVATTRASTLSGKGMETQQAEAVAAMELLLKAGARVDEGTPRKGGGDIVTVYAGWAGSDNIRPVLDLLVRYSTPAAHANSAYWLRLSSEGQTARRNTNLAWLIKRLEE